MAVVDDFEQVAALFTGERREAPVVENENPSGKFRFMTSGLRQVA